MVKNSLLKIIYCLSHVFYFFSKKFLSKERIVILCYHRTSHSNNCSEKYWNVTPESFTAQMQYLKDSGFTTIYTYEIPDILEQGVGDKKYVCITFDDGYSDNYKHAYSVLKKFDFKANFYLSTSYIDSGYPFPFLLKKDIEESSSSMPLKKNQLKKMRDNKISFQSHGHVHQKNPSMVKEHIKKDINASLKFLSQFIENEKSKSSYVAPFGVFGINAKKIKTSLSELGIELAFLGNWGSVTSDCDLLDMKRIPIYGRDSFNEFVLKTKGAYDWVGMVHKFYKNNMDRISWS